jgi:hypothetical protein
MGGRRGIAAAVVLVVLLLAGVVTASLVGGQNVAGATPGRAAPGVPVSGAGDPDVRMSVDALEHPAAELVRTQLQAYFTAINTRDYESWVETVVPERARALPREEWLQAYGSTQDGTIRVDRIDDIEGSRVLVRVRFVSTQDLDAAPPDLQERRICWYASYPMSGVPPLLEQTGAESSRREAC